MQQNGTRLHDALHLAADLRGGQRALAEAQPVQPLDGVLARICRQLRLRVARLHLLA